jgi:hypothetical protein
MGAEKALDFVDELVFEATCDRLSDLQREIFKQAWTDKTYEAIAEQLEYSESHIKETGNELWKLLTEVLGEKVTKKNFRAALERKQRSLLQRSTDSSSQIVDAPVITSIAPHTAPPTSIDPNFVGREGAIASKCLPFVDETRWIGRTELIADLIQRLRADCRIVSLVGITGIGKTSLATKLRLEMEASKSFSRYEFISFDSELPSY